MFVDFTNCSFKAGGTKLSEESFGLFRDQMYDTLRGAFKVRCGVINNFFLHRASCPLQLVALQVTALFAHAKNRACLTSDYHTE